MKEVRTVRDLVLLWGATPTEAYDNMGRDLGVGQHVPRDWSHRGRIPAWHIGGVVAAANKRGLKGISYEFVLKLITTEHAA